jgi:hypothetical protein
MDGSSFDRLAKAFTEPRSRRGLSRLLGGLAVGGPLALLGVTESEAKKKKKVTLCHEGQTISVSKKAKKKHLKHGDTLGECPTSPPGPVTGPGKCGNPSGAGGGMSTRRFAQTFLPPRSGQLTQAEIFLILNPDNFSLTFDIRGVTSAGTPGAILASTVVDGILGTSGGDVQRVEATFATPATITVGQPYALVVSAATDFGLKTNGSGPPCPDGRLFTDADATNAWVDSGTDLVYAVTIP